jgi:hypothetical protein
MTNLTGRLVFAFVGLTNKLSALNSQVPALLGLAR